jgi:ribonuclease HII
MNQYIAGVDEAGRGPLAGPVSAAAVILNPERPIIGLADSKKLSAKKREALANEIQTHALAWAVAWASVEEIDTLNILQASLLAMKRAVEHLKIVPTLVRVDGNRAPNLSVPCETLVGGDALDAAISAASILAKVHRDRLMLKLDQEYPQYGFSRHAGYPTKLHIAALDQWGISPVHRRSFAPVLSRINKTTY